MKQVPKYIEKLLIRRMMLSNDLAKINGKIYDYCEKIGVDLDAPDAVLLTDVRIYCEVDAGYSCTMLAILKALNKGENHDCSRENRGGRL